MRTILLLTASNCFMTVAWYGHLRHKHWPLWTAILISWLIALPEYMLQVPANRYGHATFSAPQLKIIQEVISIAVFVVFCVLYLREPIRWNHGVAFLLVLAAAGFAVLDRPQPRAEPAGPVTQATASP